MQHKWCTAWFLTTCWFVPSQSLRSRFPHSSPLPQFYCSAWGHMVWNIPLANWGQLSWLCPLQLLVQPQPCFLAGQENLKNPWLSVSPAQHQLKHQCVIDTILILNSKHSHVPVTKKKIMSIPAKTRTFFKCAFEMAQSTVGSPWQSLLRAESRPVPAFKCY